MFGTLLEHAWNFKLNLGGLWGGFGTIFGDFWIDFGWIFGAFGKDLGEQTMIRATKGKSRSTTHWKGSWIVGLGPKGLAFRWFAVRSGDLHSSFFQAFF